MDLNMFICGIGGQGVVFLGSFLRKYFLKKYPNAIIVGTESRGVSQREGSVISTVRVQKSERAREIFSPEIPLFGADIVIALEPMELLRNFSKVNEQTLIILNNEPIIPKSSVLGITSKLKDEHTQNDVNHSQPEWIVKKTGELQKLYPLRTIKEQISLQHIDKEVKVIKNLISFSTSSRILDLNFTSLVLDELGSTTYLNLVMTSFLATLMDTWLDYKDIKSFLKREFQDIKSLLEKNQNALKFGEILAINYSRLRNFS